VTAGSTLPKIIRTERLLLRPWRAEDARELGPILVRDHARLSPWIPARVAEPAGPDALAARLSSFTAEFEADREWRFGLFTRDETMLLGEIDLFPRDASARAPYVDADRVEVGYWLRSDATGQGFVTEGARGLLGVAATLSRCSRAEIRCDARNAASAAVPRRLGFVHTATVTSGVTAEPEVRTAELSLFWQQSQASR
jgi:RimJ/RimL family protein N-acetyltransferase